MYKLGEKITPDQAKRFAIETAKQGRGFVAPNPLVGCVIVDKNECFLAAGAHLRFGEAHAEINALNAVSDEGLLVGATLYVTLEPCSHQGNTPPCAKRLAELPIKKVVYGIADVNPQVSGQGLELLKLHGKTVEPFEQYQAECRELVEQHHFHVQHQRPFMALKVGASFDGKMALQSGESQWITGEESRIHARQLRGHYDATMVGAGTLQYDDPSLDFRDTSFADQKQNKIVILDPKGRACEDFQSKTLFEKHDAKNIFVLTREEHMQKWAKNLVHVIPWEASSRGWELALKNLYQKGISSLYIEGGSFVYGQILTHGLAQKLYLFQSPKLIGEGMSWTHYFKNGSLQEVPELKNWQSLPIGSDRLHIAYF